MARPEPFRALLEKAKQAETRPMRLVSTPPAPSASPALVLDDEHKRPTLEQRLDAAVLAGVTPPHGLRTKRQAKSLVPLRLEPPPPTPRPVPGADDHVGPRPRMLQFLMDEVTVPGIADDSVSAIPRLEPVLDSGKVEIAFGIRTNVYRLGSLLEEDTPSRPLPIIALDDMVDAETRVKRRLDKVMTRKSLDGREVMLRAFSFNDIDIAEITADGFSEVDRANHAVAAVALPALSEEGLGIESFDDMDLGGDDLDELARQLGIEGLAVPRTTPPTRADDSLDGSPASHLSEEGIEEIDADDVELVAVATPTNPMRAMVVSRPVVAIEAAADVDDDDDILFADGATPPSGAPKLPSSLLAGIAAKDLADLDADGFDDEHDVTPTHGTMRPSLEAPSAVRFVVAEAPARPRKDALTAKEKARNRERAHDLYLIALDDIASRDPHSAIVHLELALAYDDDTALYSDLLAQLVRQVSKQHDGAQR